MDIYENKLLELSDKTSDLSKKLDLTASDLKLFVKKNKSFFLLSLGVLLTLLVLRPGFVMSKDIKDKKVIYSLDTSKLFIWWVMLSVGGIFGLLYLDIKKLLT
jgi:hypothetical protein